MKPGRFRGKGEAEGIYGGEKEKGRRHNGRCAACVHFMQAGAGAVAQKLKKMRRTRQKCRKGKNEKWKERV